MAVLLPCHSCWCGEERGHSAANLLSSLSSHISVQTSNFDKRFFARGSPHPYSAGGNKQAIGLES